MTSEKKQEFTYRVTRANPTELVVILYDMTLEYIAEAKAADTDYALAEAITLTRGCINELMASLNQKYPPAEELLKLYYFCIRRLAAAERKKELEPILEVEKVIRPLRDAYAQIAPQNTAGPVMGNSQTVYAGLTYGRNTLTENMTDNSSNRGLRV